MTKKNIQTVCGYSCNSCEHLGKECAGCVANEGKPFWTTFVGVETCPIYDCCVNERKFRHCGLCPELMCERFTRFRDPDMTEEQAHAVLIDMEHELRSRK